jgi:hypothetical protein
MPTFAGREDRGKHAALPAPSNRDAGFPARPGMTALATVATRGSRAGLLRGLSGRAGGA